MLLFSLSALVTKQKYSAVSLCNISTEVLKVINATEELIAESSSPCDGPAEAQDRGRGPFPVGTDPARLDEQLTTLEENVRAGPVEGPQVWVSSLCVRQLQRAGLQAAPAVPRVSDAVQ